METETKVVAMYLPQYHETEENNLFWGKGFTDWVAVRNSKALYAGHNQPRVPLGKDYYDLSRIETLERQVALAREYGVDAFGVYHYWFSSEKQALQTPARLLLNAPTLAMPYFFSWDNASWKRTWSAQHGNAWSPVFDTQGRPEVGGDGLLIKLDYGKKDDWTKHFDYLLPFFKDERYVKVEGKPVFSILNYVDTEVLAQMQEHWRDLARSHGFPGVFFLGRFDGIRRSNLADAEFLYEPVFSGWQKVSLLARLRNKVVKEVTRGRKPMVYRYGRIWRTILSRAKRSRSGDGVLFGAFVDYDDTPRRGVAGKVTKGGGPSVFERNLRKLLSVARAQSKPFIFVTAWNEWGEGAYLEPDEKSGFAYLEALRRAKE